MRADQASATARLVALGVLLRATDPAYAQRILPTTQALMAAALDLDRGRIGWLARHLHWWPVRALLYGLEGLLLPKLSAHYVLRKQALQLLAERAVLEGVRRVVILGAGLDGLGCAIARTHAQVKVIECDHPATQSAKRTALSASNQWPSNLELRPLDLCESSAVRALRVDLNQEPAPATLIVAEAVAMYLAPTLARRLLREFARSRSVIALTFTYLDGMRDDRPGFCHARPWTHAWLAQQREPFRWALAPQDMQRVLNACGFEAVASTCADASSGALGLPRLAAAGEALCHARRRTCAAVRSEAV